MQPNSSALQPIISYNEAEGLAAGGGNYISSGGAYVAKITEAKYVKASTGSSGIEFSVETVDGLKAQYITVYYIKQNGESIKGGSSVINAMMGLLGISGITAKPLDKEYICPEFTGKTIGLFLQKTLYTKNNNTDGYKFDIRVPFDSQTSKTLREKVGNEQARTVEVMGNNYKDNDERRAVQHEGNAGFDPSSFDDDLPFN